MPEARTAAFDAFVNETDMDRMGRWMSVALSGLLMCVAIGVALASFATEPPEVTWSVMHPTKLDPAYMARVAEKARSMAVSIRSRSAARATPAWAVWTAFS